MTTVYFVRHAEPNYNNHNDLFRELTDKGLEDRKLVTQFLIDKKIDKIFSSPYKRAFDTVKDFADLSGLKIEIFDNFKERKVESVWIDDFDSFCKKQWEDFNYKLSDGESLNEVQLRNIEALNQILYANKDKNSVVGSHGTALSTIINYYDKSFGYMEFQKIKTLMPWIVEFNFLENTCVKIKQHNLFV